MLLACTVRHALFVVLQASRAQKQAIDTFKNLTNSTYVQCCFWCGSVTCGCSATPTMRLVLGRVELQRLYCGRVARFAHVCIGWGSRQGKGGHGILEEGQLGRRC